MAFYVVRVWLPDRPGALGQVASRIGGVRGDVVGIEILERGAGRVIDELVVALPDDELVELLIAEIDQVDGVDVEDVRPVLGERLDTQISALEIAERLVREPDAEAALSRLCRDLFAELAADWVTVVALEPVATVAATGEAPSAAWLAAFLDGTSHLESSEDEGSAPPDLAWGVLPASGLVLVIGRRGRAFRSRERRQAGLLARVTDGLLAQFGAVATPAGGAA